MEAETPSKSLETLSDEIAIKWGISTSTLRNLVWSESRWNPKEVSPQGDRGLVQINKDAWPDITDEQAFDPEFALNFAAEKISEGKEHYWVVCNCVSAVKLKTKIPKMAEIVPNTSLAPKTVAIFDYKGVKHIAYVESVEKDSFTVFESNYRPCLLERRSVSMFDKSIVGFWKMIE